MNKEYPIYQKNEIDLGEIFRILWNEKIKVVLIALTIFVIIVSYDNSKPKESDLYENSLVISPTKENELLKFVTIFNYINKSKSEENFIIKELKNTKVLDRFVEEFSDYKELIAVLKENENIKKDIALLSIYEQNQKLYSYAKLFNIEKSKTGNPGYVLKFTWTANNREIRDILTQALTLTLVSLRESIFLELESYYKLETDLIINKDLARIEYLLEQSAIAKQIGIVDKRVLNIIPNDLSFPSIEYKGGKLYGSATNSSDFPYYSRGYKTIDMEISLIKNRRHLSLENIRNEIDELKKKNVQWVDYNIFLLDTKKLKNKKQALPSTLAILFSLIIGIVYVLISNALQSPKFAKEK